MALNTANRASDGRRAKWASNRSPQENLADRITREIESRPKSRYELDEMVLVPNLGIRGITDKYYRAGSGWHYTFYTRNGLHTYKEKQLLPKGDAMLLQDVMRTIAAGG